MAPATTGTRPRRASIAALLPFAQRHLQVRMLFGSLQQHEHGYRLEPRSVGDHNLIHVTRGRAVWSCGGQEHRLEPGDLIIIPPGEPHQAWSLTPAVTIGSLHVLVTLPGGQDLLALLQPARKRAVAPGSALDVYFRGAMAEYQRTDQDRIPLMVAPWATLVVRELIESDAQAGLLGGRGLDPLVAGILSRLERTMGQRTSLSDVVALAGFSAQHLNRLCRRELGMTPLQCLAHMRMERAAAFLREGRLGIAAVAARVGFGDPDYFSRQFHRYWGQSPTAYQHEAGSDRPG